MEVKWFNAKDKEGVASFYLTNIDLNIVASVPFQYAYRVQVGVDDKGNIIIKPSIIVFDVDGMKYKGTVSIETSTTSDYIIRMSRYIT